MGSLLRKLGYVTAVAIACYCVFFVLTSPKGIPAVIEKHREYERMRSEVQVLQEKRAKKRAEVEQLLKSEEARKRAIREHLHKTLPGETMIYLPEGEAAKRP